MAEQMRWGDFYFYFKRWVNQNRHTGNEINHGYRILNCCAYVFALFVCFFPSLRGRQEDKNLLFLRSHLPTPVAGASAASDWPVGRGRTPPPSPPSSLAKPLAMNYGAATITANCLDEKQALPHLPIWASASAAGPDHSFRSSLWLRPEQVSRWHFTLQEMWVCAEMHAGDW